MAVHLVAPLTTKTRQDQGCTCTDPKCGRCNLLNFLIQLEQKKCCEGTGINNVYSEECEGFLPPDQVYGKCRGYERCIACRNQRKLIQKKDYNYTTNQNKYKKQGRVIKNVLRENVSLKERTEQYEQEMEELKSKWYSTKEEIFDSIVSSLPEEQREIVRCCIDAAKHCSSKGRRYTMKWIYECLLLRIKSRKAYEHVRNHNLLPLPSLQTLNKYMTNLDSAYGFNIKVFECLKKKASEMAECDRRGVLLLDEIKLSEGVWFDKKDMKFSGFVDLGEYTPIEQQNKLGDHALVLLFQPFRGQWVQIVGVFVSRGCAVGHVQQHIILEAVKLLESSNFPVDAVTTDAAQWNRAVWKLFDVNETTISCEHPFDHDRRLWFNSDYSHLLKNFRNFVVSQSEIMTPYGIVKLIHWEALLEVEKENTLSLKIAYKLTKHHIKPEGYQKMNVPLAAELFSDKVAAGMTVFQYKHKDLSDCEPTVKFIQLIHRLNSAMTSRTPQNALYMNENNINYKAIQDFLGFLYEWESLAVTNDYKFIPSNTLTGLKVTLNACLEILQFLVEKCSYNYLMTAKLTQDALERLVFLDIAVAQTTIRIFGYL